MSLTSTKTNSVFLSTEKETFTGNKRSILPRFNDIWWIHGWFTEKADGKSTNWSMVPKQSLLIDLKLFVAQVLIRNFGSLFIFTLFCFHFQEVFFNTGILQYRIAWSETFLGRNCKICTYYLNLKLTKCDNFEFRELLDLLFPHLGFNNNLNIEGLG